MCDRRMDSDWFWRWHREIRSGMELDQMHNLLNMLPSSISSEADKWNWMMNGKAIFSVAQIRKCIDQKCLQHEDRSNTWNKWVPKKVNIFVWRLMRNGIPTKVNLFGRGVDVNSYRCNLCKHGIDDISHLFVNCELAKELMVKINNWLQLSIPEMEVINMIDWCKQLNCTSYSRTIMEAIIYIGWWHVWKERNNVLHTGNHDNLINIFNSIVTLSFLWISSRDRKHSYTWEKWVVNHMHR